MRIAPCPVVDKNGTWYPSQRAFLKAAGIAMPTLQYHLNRHGNLNRVGMGNSRPGNRSAARKTRVGCRSFVSRKAAAEWLGISIYQFNRWTRASASPRCRDMLMAAYLTAIATRPESKP